MSGERRRVALVSGSARLGRRHLAPLEEGGFELVERFELDGCRDVAEVVEGLQGIWASIAGSEGYSRDVLRSLPQLRAIARCGVGYDAIDVQAATEQAVVVSTATGANADAVADMTVLLMLACLRRLHDLEECVRSGRWRPDGLARDLSGATVGLVGLGDIGKAVARRLRGFECRVLGAEPRPDPEFCARWRVEIVALDDLLPQVDVLTIHTPLTGRTHHLIGERELTMLRSGAVVINTARGGVLDEMALMGGLQSGRIAGAGLDVFEGEPLTVGHPLIEFQNAVLTGHSASFTEGAVARTMRQVVRNLLNLKNGVLPEGAVNPDVTPSWEDDWDANRQQEASGGPRELERQAGMAAVPDKVGNGTHIVEESSS